MNGYLGTQINSGVSPRSTRSSGSIIQLYKLYKVRRERSRPLFMHFNQFVKEAHSVNVNTCRVLHKAEMQSLNIELKHLSSALEI